MKKTHDSTTLCECVCLSVHVCICVIVSVSAICMSLSTCRHAMCFVLSTFKVEKAHSHKQVVAKGKRHFRALSARVG